MKSKYLIDPTQFELPEIDPLITAFVEKQTTYWADDIFHLAIQHNGVVYRVVICEEGISDLMPFNDFMHDHGYIDLAGNNGSFKGYSSFFVHKSTLR